MFKKFGLAFRTTREVKASLSKAMEGYTEDEAIKIYNSDKKLTKLAEDIYLNLSEDVKNFMPFETFKNMMLKQRKEIKKDPSIVDKFKNKK